jgi:cytochrome c biogenesis protein CcdA
MQKDYEKLYMAILALVIIVATFYLGNILLTTTVPNENRDIINVALGMILGLSGTVVGYYFGSSKSSSDKTKILKDDTDSLIDSERKKEYNDGEV